MALLTPELYSKLEDIGYDIEETYPELEDLEQVPEIIKDSACWSVLRDKVEAPWLLSPCNSRGVTVLLVQLKEAHACGDPLVVIKAIAAEHAAMIKQQIQAEIRIASLFAWHPLMAALLCHDKDKEGNVVMLSPYAGVCLADIQAHTDWYDYLTEPERTEVYAVLEAHCMTVLALMQQADVRGGYLYRDTKPENLAFDLRTGQFKVIDFGLAMHISGSDFHDGYTPGYITPEMCKPGKDKKYSAFLGPDLEPGTFNATTDVYLHGLMGLDLIAGLPEHLQPDAFDISSDEGVLHMLKTHNKANFPALVKQVRSSKARDYLRQAMNKDPKKRLTPAAALRHPFLAPAAAAVQAEVGQTLPAYCQQAYSVVSLLQEVKQRKTAMFLCTWHQQQWLEQQQQTDDDCIDEDDCSPAAPATPVRGSSSSSSDKNCTGPCSCSSTDCTHDLSDCGSSDVTAAAVDDVPVDAVVIVDTASIKSQRDSWLQKGMQWFKQVSGSSSSSGRSHKSSKHYRSSETHSDTVNKTVSSAAAVVPAPATPCSVIHQHEELLDEVTAGQVKVPGLCGLRFSFKRSR